jgi:MoaA/NifB/PqqE/SkfB family radical SAM enzyme
MENLSKKSNPEIIMVELTQDCNNNCFYCYQNREVKNKLNIDGVKERIIEYRKFGIKYIEFSGGEPTLSPYLPELIQLARNEKYENISILTNGRRLAYKEYFTKLLKSGLKTVVFAIPGHTSDLYEKITRTEKGSFNQLAEGLKIAKGEENNVEIGTVTVINRHNYQYLPEIVDWISKKDTSFITLSYPIPFGKAENQENIPTYAEIFPYIKKALDRHGGKQKICIEAVPFCQLPQYEKYILNEIFQKDCLILDSAGDISNRLEDLKLRSTKIKKCIDCDYESRCVGLFIDYIDSHNMAIEKKEFEEQKVALDIQNGPCDYDYIFCTRELNGKRYHELKRDTAVVNYEKLKLFFETSSKVSSHLDIWGRERVDEFKDIFKILKIAKGYFKNITLWSSGLKLNRPKILRFIKNGVTKFEIPIYGASEKTHEIITNKKGSFRRVISTLKILDKLNGEISLHMVILKQNFKEFPRAIKLASNYKRATLSAWFYYPDPAMDHKGVNLYKKYCSSYSEIIECLSHHLEEVKNIHFKLVFFPRCIFSKIKKIARKAELIETGFVRFMAVGSKNMEYKFLTGKGEFGSIFSDECNSCFEKKRCSGIFSEYLKIYGDSEFTASNTIAHRLTTNNFYKAMDDFQRKYGVYSNVLPEIIAVKYNLKEAATFYISSKKELKEEYPIIKDLCEKEGLYIDYARGWRCGEAFIAIISSKKIIPVRAEMEENPSNRFSYPSCCEKLYKQRKYLPYHFENNLRSYFLKNSIFDFRMNPFFHDTPFHLYLHLPCSLDCKRTLAFAKKLLDIIKIKNKILYSHIINFNKSPIFFTDICCSGILLKGSMKGNKINYKSCYSDSLFKSSIKKSKCNILADLTLYNRIISMLLKGNEVELIADKLIIRKDGMNIHTFNKPKHLIWKLLNFV